MSCKKCGKKEVDPWTGSYSKLCAECLSIEHSENEESNSANALIKIETMSAKEKYCTSCNNRTTTPKIRGRGWIEIVLWLCYIIPGLIYTIWRRSGDPSICPTCDKETLIPVTLASAQSYTQISQDQPRDEIECPWCAEIILAKAKICKHCGKYITST